MQPASISFAICGLRRIIIVFSLFQTNKMEKMENGLSPNIKEVRESSNSITVFKLVDLADMYTSQMEQLGADIGACVYAI